jgi:hypothetical protein
MPQVANALRSTALAALTGGQDVVFPEGAYGSLQERFVYNPNAAGSIWINPFGGVAAANASGCIEIPPGTGWSAKSTSAINALGTAGAKITAGEL